MTLIDQQMAAVHSLLLWRFWSSDQREARTRPKTREAASHVTPAPQ